MRFKGKVRDESESSAEAGKIHIDTAPKTPLSLVGSQAEVGTTTEEGGAGNEVAVEASFVGGEYSAGLADQAQSSATIDNEMAQQIKTVSQSISDETTRATKAEDDIKTDYTKQIENNKQERQAAEQSLDAAISKEQNARKQADDTRAKSENDVTQNLNDQLSKLNDKVSQCSQNVQKAVQKANSLESIVNAYTDKKGGGTKIAFISEYEHINHLHRLHAQFEKMQAKHNF